MTPMNRSGRAALLALTLLAACSGPSKPAPEEQRRLAGAAVAKVGDVVLTKELVAEVARARRCSPREALDLLVEDALLAQAARDRGLDGKQPTAWRIEAARGRATARRIHVASGAGQPPSDEEVRALTERHFWDLDRAESVRVVHAISLRSPKEDPAVTRARGEQLLAAVQSATDKDTFMALAKAVKDVRVEELPPFVADGRSANGGGFDPTFVKASFALEKPGKISPLVDTPFGFHVILLVERLPPMSVPLAERRARLTEEAFHDRARAAVDKALAEQKKGASVEVSPAAESAMSSLFEQR